MKKIFLIIFVVGISAACTENKEKETRTEENPSSPAPGNSNATNPSVPDTVSNSDSLKK